METEELFEHVREAGAYFGLNLLAAIAILVIGWWIAKLIQKGVLKGLERANLEPILVRFFSSLVYALLMVFVIIGAISRLGVQTASLIALVGAAGLAVGLAMQGSLANLAAGVLLIIFRPYRIGDFIEGGGTSGTVEEVQIFTTVLKTPDSRRVIVPNSQMMGGTITNFSSHPQRRVDLTVGVSYDADSDHVRRVVQDVLAADERVLAQPEPVVAMLAHGDSSVEWIVRPWVQTADYWKFYWDTMEAIKRAFDREGISIPYPQRDVHIYNHQVEEKQAAS